MQEIGPVFEAHGGWTKGTGRMQLQATRGTLRAKSGKFHDASSSAPAPVEQVQAGAKQTVISARYRHSAVKIYPETL